MAEAAFPDPLSVALRRSRSTFVAVGLFSAAVNVLMLTGPLFMLQVYDRVLASGSVPTLVALFGLVAVLFAFLGLFDFIRNKALARTAYSIDMELVDLARKAWVRADLAVRLVLDGAAVDGADVFLGASCSLSGRSVPISQTKNITWKKLLSLRTTHTHQSNALMPH